MMVRVSLPVGLIMESVQANGVFSWLRMKKPGPGVAMVRTGFQLFMSTTSMAPPCRLGLASTVVPFQAKVMPEPRCGIPAMGRSATLPADIQVHHLGGGAFGLGRLAGPRCA